VATDLKLDSTGLTGDSFAQILGVTQKLAQPLDLLQMLGEVVKAGKSVLEADNGALWLYEAGTNELVMKFPVLDPAPRIAYGEGLVGECLRNREIINVADAHGDPRFRGALDRMTCYRTETVLNVPLLDWEEQPVGVLQLMNKVTGPFSPGDERVAVTLAAQCAVAVQRAQLMKALVQNERLDEEVELAREIQMSTLPTEMPRMPGYDVHGSFVPAHRAGGDLFDLVVLEDELFILMGDATGHGFGPALSATQMQAMLRVAFRCGAGLDEAYRHVNNQLEEDLPDDRFITAFMGFLDPASHMLRYHSGGQAPILHFRADGQRCEWHTPTTFPVGVLEIGNTENARVMKMQPGDVLVLLSDGIYEYENRQGEQFGSERVAALLERYHRLPAAEQTVHILDAVSEHGQGTTQEDDITIVMVRRHEEQK